MEFLKCTCLNPIVVNTKRGKITAPCGKCAACRSLRSLRWVQRIELESCIHQYVYFCTLTYDNRFLSVARESELFELLPDENLELLKDDGYYSLLAHYGGIPYAPYRDFQLFMKRLRKLINNDKKTSLRYYVCSEYGSLSCRPHFHFILWLDDEQIACNLQKYITSAWSFIDNDKAKYSIGRIDCQPVASSAANYVAGYVNSSSRLPKILQTSFFRPIAHSSLSPSVAADVVSKEDMYRLLYGEIDYVDCEKVSFGKFGDVPLWKSLENFLFPKCKGFSFKTHRERMRLYLFSKLFVGKDEITATEFISRLRSLWSSLPTSYSRFIEEEFFQDDTPWSETAIERLSRSFYTSRVFLKRCRYFNVVPSQYIFYIDRHYARQDYKNLIKQLRYEEIICKNPSSSPFGAAFVDSLLITNQRKLSDELWLYYCSWFNLIPGVSDVMRYTFDKNPLYSSAKQLYEKIQRDSVKSKFNNEYYIEHPELKKLYG